MPGAFQSNVMTDLYSASTGEIHERSSWPKDGKPGLNKMVFRHLWNRDKERRWDSCCKMPELKETAGK